MMRLLRRVGGHPVGPGLTVLPGADARPAPAGLAAVVPAARLVRARRLAALAAEARLEHRLRLHLEDAAHRMGDLAREDPAGGAAWAGEARRFLSLLAARADDPGVLVAILREAARARHELRPGRPLVVAGDHPGLGEAVAAARADHPQVVVVPGA